MRIHKCQMPMYNKRLHFQGITLVQMDLLLLKMYNLHTWSLFMLIHLFTISRAGEIDKEAHKRVLPCALQLNMKLVKLV